MRLLKDANGEPMGWLPAYLHYTDEHEAPTQFHMWTGISVIATVLERNVWIRHKYHTIYPNLYIVLISDSAICRKSSAQRVGVRLMRKVENAPLEVAQKMSPERMIEKLYKNIVVDTVAQKATPKAAGLIFSDELAALFGRDAYKSGFMAQITTLYDCQDKWTYSTRKDQDMVLRNICVNIFGASTTEWLRASIPMDAVGGGFVGRFVLVQGHEPREREFFDLEGKVIPGLVGLEKGLVHDLSLLRNTLRGEYKMTKQAMEWFNVWYRNFKHNLPKDLLPAYTGRRHTTLLKLAMILAASSYDDLVITTDVLEGADKTLTATEKGMPGVISRIGASALGVDMQRVYSVISSWVEISRAELMRKVSHHADAEALDKIIRTLVDAEMITTSLKGKKLVYSVTEKGANE